jgi:hypothetical protein
VHTRNALLTATLLAAGLGILPGRADAQLLAAEEVVNLTPALPKTGFEPGATFQAAVVVEIAADYHLYSHGISDPMMIATELRISEESPVAWPFVRYPEDYKKPDEDVPGLVGENYYNRIIIKLVGRLPADAEVGEIAVPMSLFYQTCTEAVCLMPYNKAFTFTIPVVAPGTEVETINEEIFGEGGSS